MRQPGARECGNTSSTITTSAITKASTTSSRCRSGNQARERSDATNASAAYWATIGGRPHSAADRVSGQDGVAYFDTSEHPTYTEEEPNALPPEKVGEFLACMREVFPQHYAMAYLGFATGLRPSSMRPLRRKGSTPDVRWDEGVVLVRR